MSTPDLSLNSWNQSNSPIPPLVWIALEFEQPADSPEVAEDDALEESLPEFEKAAGSGFWQDWFGVL